MITHTEPLPLTVFVHPHVETLLESAGLALVPVGLVNGAGSVTSLAPATIKYISIRELSARSEVKTRL